LFTHRYVCKSGCIEQFQRVFDSLKEKDEASWNVIIAGYGIHGHGNKAMELFEQMQISGHKPDGFTFIGLLMACSHAGIWSSLLSSCRINGDRRD
jgi:pentatricopeptide repeat protein